MEAMVVYWARICKYLRISGIDSKESIPVLQVGLSYRPTRLNSLTESIPSNRFLVSLHFYKYGLCTVYIQQRSYIKKYGQTTFWSVCSDLDPVVPFREETAKFIYKFDLITEGQTCCEINHGFRIGKSYGSTQLLIRPLVSKKLIFYPILSTPVPSEAIQSFILLRGT